jgi:clan AA aspartic protease
MITGVVSDNLEPTIRLAVRGQHKELEVEATVDTGFNGFLTLPPSTIADLGLPRLCLGRAELANGTIDLFDIHEATVIWDGRLLTVEAESANTGALVGMGLLRGFHLQVHAVEGGAVVIHGDALPATADPRTDPG